jgi:hypothetical protein
LGGGRGRHLWVSSEASIGNLDKRTEGEVKDIANKITIQPDIKCGCRRKRKHLKKKIKRGLSCGKHQTGRRSF